MSDTSTSSVQCPKPVPAESTDQPEIVNLAHVDVGAAGSLYQRGIARYFDSIE